ncbi:hypothetical protein Gotri_020944 [Gossypium trilobum]|uniref:Uncharacterized protein n=1 Tax=Gossypium trilobum TaxID=34281 RepID=A0A7J9DB09_9ROSI|nr:hypothetical protein [Gossypium trilobum]
MENIIMGFKERDDKMTFIMKRIIDFSGNGPTNEEIQHENLQKEAGEKSNVQLKNYQPPKFQQFDGKGNPHQHIAHFVETYNSVGISGDLVSPYPRPSH